MDDRKKRIIEALGLTEDDFTTHPDKAEKLEAQIAYTALITDTLIEAEVDDVQED